MLGNEKITSPRFAYSCRAGSKESAAIRGGEIRGKS